MFASAYSRAIGSKDSEMAARIHHESLAYSATEIDFYAALNRRVLGYEPSEVMLLDDSLLNADTIDEVLALFRSRGYRFVSLSEAQRDPAYTIPDTYITKYGPMWGYRWAKEKRLAMCLSIQRSVVGAGIRISWISTKTGWGQRPARGKSTAGRRWSSSTFRTSLPSFEWA